MIMRGHDRINPILPDELILEIFRHLGSKPSRDACSVVCKRWLDLERLSRDTIRVGASNNPDALVKLLARRFINAKNVYIDERLSISLPVQFGRRRGGDPSALSSLNLNYATEKSGSEDVEMDSYCLLDAGLTAVGEGFTKLEKLMIGPISGDDPPESDTGFTGEIANNNSDSDSDSPRRTSNPTGYLDHAV